MPKVKTEKKVIRKPIVAVMGHVDHGKTTFLDSIRGGNVADKEHGGITQNTRVHTVKTKNDFEITFIDTPGHEAFSGMRERGARVTDFVLLMVAADDGIQPQTKESIKFAQANNVPIIVAINKIDLLGVDLQRVKTELSSFGVQIEEYGGDVMCFNISAKNKTGLDELLEGIELLSEVHELAFSEVEKPIVAQAFVLESYLDKNQGYQAVCILKSGNLKSRIYGVSGDNYFKVRTYLNEDGKTVDHVSQSDAFLVSGLKSDLKTGEIISFVEEESTAKKFVEEYKENSSQKLTLEAASAPAVEAVDLENVFAQMLLKRKEKQEGVDQKILPVILKTASQGTLEAAIAQIEGLEGEDAKVKVIQKGTGPVTEDDINMAKITKGIILSYQIQPQNRIISIAKAEKVIIRHYNVIYDMIDELSDVLDGMGQNFEKQVIIGVAKVKQIFVLSNGVNIAGSKVIDGLIKRGHNVLVKRGETEIYKGKIKVLRHLKDEVKEAKKNQECGILLDPNFTDLMEDDLICSYKIETV